MSLSSALHREVSNLQPGDHLCCIYETDEEHRALLTPYLRQGLERNEKVVYIVDARTAETVLRYVWEDGLDPRPFLDRGQLVILTVSDAYMRDGAFIPDRMISFLRQETDRSVGEGYGALRVTGEMSWALRRLPGSNHLIEYESKLNTFLPGSRCLALCQYDKRRFPPEILLQVLATHPVAVIGTEVYENFHFVPPEVFLTHDFQTAILGHWIEGLRIRKQVKAGEDALRESVERFRATFENSMDGILLTVPDGGVLAANPAACEMLGRTEEEVCEAGRAGVVDLSDPRLPALLEERARTGMSQGEMIFVRKDDTKFPVEITSRIYKDQHGDPRTSMIFRDITERKKQEHLLKESEEQFRVIFEGSKDGILLADAGSRRFITGNQAICDMLQYDQDEIRQLKVEDIHPREDLPGILEGFEKQARGEVESIEGLPLIRKDGSVLYADLQSNLVSVAGRKCLLGSFRDVTERRRILSLEKQVRMGQKMEAVGTLAGGIAHDFNNVLTVIIGYGEMLKRRIASDPKAVSDLDEILRGAERASTLTRQLLTFARRQVVEPLHLDLNEVVAGIVKLLRKVTREDIDIKTFPAECSVMIRADRGQVEQVVMNLCLNSCDAMPKGGQLVIETGATSLEEGYLKQYPYMIAGRYAVLSVSDTGIGMDEKTRERIFEPFFTTKAPDKGTGLGLAVVYGIVKQHNGFIHVYSEPGKGTTFRVYFPEVNAPVDVRVIASQGVARGGSETILLAEDNESVRHLTEQMLISFGYKVLTACDGEEAVDIFRRHGKKIAMAVLDVVMPKKGGKQAYDEIARMSPGLKVLFLSGYSANAIHDDFVLHTGLSFLQKPFAPNALARKVREVLDRM